MKNPLKESLRPMLIFCLFGSFFMSYGEETIKSGSADKILGLWHFDEGEGETAKDSSGTGADLKFSGATWADGKKGKCLSLEAKGSCAYTSKIYPCFELTGKEFTISCWIKPEYEYPKTMFIVSNAHTLRGPGYWFGLDYGAVVLGSGEGKKFWKVVTPRFKEGKIPEKITKSYYKGIIDNRWYHLALTFKDGVYRLYVDGRMVCEKKGKAVIPAKHRLMIGNRNPRELHYCYKGLIDEVEILNRAKTGEEIIDDAILTEE